MKQPANAILLVFSLLGSFVAGSWYSKRGTRVKAESAGRRILYYVDPMHPAYRSDRPGIAPDCGMKLEPVYADGKPAAGEEKLVEPASPSPGAVRVSPEKQQLIGVQVAEVTRGPGSHTLRVLGRVALDETRVYRVAMPVDGLVRTAGPVVSGSIVKKGEVLATFYNRDFLTAQQTYLYALNTMDRFKENEGEDQLKLTRAQMQAAEENLEFLGMGETQLQNVARTRQIAKNIELRSPLDGLVLARNAFPGLRFERGTELYRIADLGHVWVLADVFENEAQYFRPGAGARVVLPNQGRAFHATVSEALPQFDATSRTLKLRLETDNAGYALRPDMFVDVELPISFASTIFVPADAVLDSGLRKTVFVDLGNGYFQPRTVETGLRYGDRVEIVKGLAPGERIVISGNFLIDSESRMKLAAGGMRGAAETANKVMKDPVCGMELDAKEAGATGKKSDYQGKTYYFCSDHCKRQFERDRARYVARTSEVAHHTGRE